MSAKKVPPKARRGPVKATVVHQMHAPSPARQVRFHQLLAGARKTWLMDALSETLDDVDPGVVKEQIGEYVPADAQRILAAAGIRDEHVFPVPAVIASKPTLVGYYRLLLGVPQKSFYAAGSGMGRLRRLEDGGTVLSDQDRLIQDFCRVMSRSLADLVRQIPAVTMRDIAELPLLTIGSQFQGGNNNEIGQEATREAFATIGEIVRNAIVERDERRIVLKNASGRRVLIALGSDPDVRIEEQMSDSVHHVVAIEIKGGTDRSNAHNRAGEAEKSHQKARGAGFRDFWTIIATTGLDLGKLRSESPTTTSWFDATQVLGRSGEAWEAFRERLAHAVGIPL